MLIRKAGNSFSIKQLSNFLYPWRHHAQCSGMHVRTCTRPMVEALLSRDLGVWPSPEPRLRRLGVAPRRSGESGGRRLSNSSGLSCPPKDTRFFLGKGTGSSLSGPPLLRFLLDVGLSSDVRHTHTDTKTHCIWIHSIIWNKTMRFQFLLHPFTIQNRLVLFTEKLCDI